jgi:hypothetical protein
VRNPITRDLTLTAKWIPGRLRWVLLENSRGATITVRLSEVAAMGASELEKQDALRRLSAYLLDSQGLYPYRINENEVHFTKEQRASLPSVDG